MPGVLHAVNLTFHENRWSRFRYLDYIYKNCSFKNIGIDSCVMNTVILSVYRTLICLVRAYLDSEARMWYPMCFC